MRQGWRRRLGDRVIRHPRLREIRPVRVKIRPPRTPSRQLTSPFILLYGFASLIGVGTLLLLLPVSNVQGTFTPFIAALFTATSAVTVTGLIVVDTAQYWSPFGQAVILALIFIGGLGFMTTATFLLIFIGQRITLSNRLMMRETIGSASLGGVVRLTRNIVFLALGAQFLGFILLIVHLRGHFPQGTAVWQAGFHAVSGFNNAGFTILPNSTSLSRFSTDLGFLGIMGALIILGGIGYTVLADIVRHRRFSRFSLDTQLVLVLSLALWILGAVILFFLEWHNPATIGNLSFLHQAGESLFQSVSARTAGFTSIDFSGTHSGTNFFYISLMFIGGASASTAGGVKVNTFAVILVAVVAAIRSRTRVEAFGREIPAVQVFRAVAIVALALVAVFAIGLSVTLLTPGGFESPNFLRLIFATVSAFGANGTSTGITADLTKPVQLIFAFTMFLGRLGPLTFALALAQREERAVYRYAQERVKIG